MGTQIDALHGNGLEYVEAVFCAKNIIAHRQRTPWLWPSFIFENLPVGRRLDRAIGVMHKKAYQVR